MARSRPTRNLVLSCIAACIAISLATLFPPGDIFASEPSYETQEGSFLISTSDQQQQSSVNTTTLWCAASKEGSFPEGKDFHHFPHAMEYMARCWSWFIDQDAFPGRCGFSLDRFTEKRLLERANTAWAVTIIEATGCKVRAHEPVVTNGTNNMYTPDLSPKSDLLGHTWVDKPEHAWKLRDLLLQHGGKHVQPRSNSTIRIGFVDRPDTRRIVNMDELMLNVTKLYDNVVIDRTWFTSATPMVEQIAWFASHEIIIGAHGAAMTNCLFLQPGTHIIEIFPKNYFPVDFFGSLITQVGGIHKPLYADHRLPEKKVGKDMRQNLRAGVEAYRMISGKSAIARHTWRNLDITIHIPDVVFLLESSLKRILDRIPENISRKRRAAYLLRVDRLLNKTKVDMAT